MKPAMRKFFRGRGITAVQFARRLGLFQPTDIYPILDGRMKLDNGETAKLKHMLCDVFGMTEAEWKEAMP